MHPHIFVALASAVCWGLGFIGSPRPARNAISDRFPTIEHIPIGRLNSLSGECHALAYPLLLA
jgi:hypothetical protein